MDLRDGPSGTDRSLPPCQPTHEPALEPATAEAAPQPAPGEQARGIAGEWKEAFTLAPPSGVPPAPQKPSPAPQGHPVQPGAGLPEHERGSAGLNRYLWSVSIFLLTVLLSAYFGPLLVARWRAVESEADAEAAYLKRRAELRAEAEAAGQMLDLLDKRVNLTSLGFRNVVRKVTPTVVNVACYREEQAGPPAKGGTRVFDPDTQKYYRQVGVGSGVIVRPGLVLTNHHVIYDRDGRRPADQLRLTLASGQAVGLDVAKNVVSDAMTDLAVIRLPEDAPAAVRAEAKVSVEFADSDKEVQRGDLVLALGNPLGLKHTVTHGIVSAKGRLLDRHSLVDMIQTDAAINPGNSGGPLFDQFGRLVGINVAIASDNGGNQGIAFAIPSNVAKKVFDELVEKGEVVRGYLGVGLAELPHEQAAALGLTRAGGALVTKVEDGEAAGRAGMKVGDVIVAFNKEALAAQHPIRQLRQLISECPVGQDVAVDVLRDGQRQTLQVQLGKRPPNVP